MSGFLNRKPQPTQGSPNRIDFPKDAQEAKDWSRIVRFIRLDEEHHITYKYCRHVFATLPGQGPHVDREGNPRDRGPVSIAYCLGSPSNPYTQDQSVEMNEEGVAECMSILLPNNVPLHDMVGREGKPSIQLRERCLVWSWSNNHLAIIDRPPGFFDKLQKMCAPFGGDPFYYNKNNPGFDVVIQTSSKGGTFYDYAFNTPPLNAERDILNVLHLIKAQRESVFEDFNVVQTKEAIIQHLGVSGGTVAPTSGPPKGDEFGAGQPQGSSQALNDGDGLDDMGDDL